MALKIGLTGGIGSGKSAACEIFSELGVPVIDADNIAHSLVKPGMPAFKEIIKMFGNEVISSDGTLDRKIIRNSIFANQIDRKKLEDLLHPHVYREIAVQVETINSKYCIIDAIIDSQISRKDRLSAADDIVDNKGDIDNLRKRIRDLHEFYLSI